MGLTWVPTMGVGRAHQIDHASIMNPVKRSFFFIFVFIPPRLSFRKNLYFHLPLFSSAAKNIFLGRNIMEKHLSPPASQLVYGAKERVLLFRHILSLYLYVAPLFLKLLVWLLSFQSLLCSQTTASLWRMYYYISHLESISFKAPQPIKMRKDPLKLHTTVPKMS
jgi:hypothetical protein